MAVDFVLSVLLTIGFFVFAKKTFKLLFHQLVSAG